MNHSPLKSFSTQKQYKLSYDYYTSNEKLTYFRLLVIAIEITCFVALIVFTIQEQDEKLVVSMAIISALNFIMIFFSKWLQIYLKYVLGLLYICYVGAVTVVGTNGVSVPLFIHGYSSGIMFTTLIQFCEYKLKILFTLTTPWVFFALFNDYAVSNIHFIVYTLSTSALQAYLTYEYDNKEKQIFFQNDILKKQENVIKKFTSDCLFAISFDKRKRIFQLEFANALFENTYSDDIKEFLRNHVVIQETDCSVQKRLPKQETLEEYLFENNKIKVKWEDQNSFNLKVENKLNQNLHDLQITRVYFYKQIYFIAIKSKQSNNQIEKYEKMMQQLKDAIMNLTSEVGIQLQLIYRTVMSKGQSHCNLDILKILQVDILLMLNRMKNYQIFYSKEKSFLIHCSNESYELKLVLNTLLQLFEVKCNQQQKKFIYSSSLSNENLCIRLDQKLLTQIMVNIFQLILNFTTQNSIIRFTITMEDNQNFKQQKLTQRSYCSKQEFYNSQEFLNNQVLQINFTFTCDNEIENFTQILSYKENSKDIDINSEQEIINLVNYLILRIIGPYNNIITNQLGKLEHQVKFLYEVKFYLYTDITNLDSSFIKHFKVWS